MGPSRSWLAMTLGWGGCFGSSLSPSFGITFPLHSKQTNHSSLDLGGLSMVPRALPPLPTAASPLLSNGLIKSVTELGHGELTLDAQRTCG